MAKGTDRPNKTAGVTAAAPGVEPFGKKPLRLFALAIALPAFLLYVSSVAMVLVALSMMAQHIDRIEAKRGVTAMHAALDSFINDLSTAVADEGTWNEAHLNVVVSPDPAWMDSTWGTTARLGTTYDDVIVTDAAGNIQFGENNLGPIRGAIKARYPAAPAMLKELDRAISQSGDAAVIAHFASAGQSAVGLAAVSIHRSTPGEGAVSRNGRRILWIAKHIDATLLQEIAVRYQVPLGRIVVDVPSESSTLDIVDAEGNVAGTIAWEPDRPGETAFRNAALIASLVFFGIGVLLVLGLGMLRRAMLRHAAKIETGFAGRAVAALATVVATAAPTTEATLAPAEAGAPSDSAVAGVTAADFTVEYQPILDLRAETMVGVKALLRWKQPDGSPLLEEDLSPADCATLMERASIMALRHATGELAPLLGVMLTLSITPAQLVNGIFAEKIAGTLGATNFPARRLQLSVDTSLLPPVDAVLAPIAELRRMGISVAFASFTLSPVTLGYIRPGLADRLCLDPKMISGIDTDQLRLKLVEATIDAARTAEADITVPGIERREEAAKLLRLGCREFRGPLLAKPLAIGPLTNLILAPARPQAKAS